MKGELLNKFSEFMEKQDVLIKLTESEKLHTYSYSEVGVVLAVGYLENPNVTAISKTLKLTKGAVSKITKRLTGKGLLRSYMLPNNNQKIYFALTEAGETLCTEHEKRHSLWVARDMEFLKRFSDGDLERISAFMDEYNAYLKKMIDELSKKRKG